MVVRMAHIKKMTGPGNLQPNSEDEDPLPPQLKKITYHVKYSECRQKAWL